MQFFKKVPLSSVIKTSGLICNIYFLSLAEQLFLLYFLLLSFSYACLFGSGGGGGGFSAVV